MPTESTGTLDMTSSDTSGRHLSKFEKEAEDAASDGCGSNFSGPAFQQAQSIGELLVIITVIRSRDLENEIARLRVLFSPSVMFLFVLSGEDLVSESSQ